MLRYRLRSVVMAWVAVLAIVLQLGAPSLHPAMANTGTAEAVAAFGELAALLGPNVALCLHEDGSAPGPPAHDQHDCCPDCALCQHAGHSAAVVPPSSSIPIPYARQPRRVRLALEAVVAAPRLIAFAQPRAPPISA